MSIAGPLPEAGFRIDVERPRDGGPPWIYRGFVVTPDARIAIAATVSDSGEVVVRFAGSSDGNVDRLPDVVAEKARLLFRTAWKLAHEESLPPPRHVVRWRADTGLASPPRPR